MFCILSIPQQTVLKYFKLLVLLVLVLVYYYVQLFLSSQFFWGSQGYAIFPETKKYYSSTIYRFDAFLVAQPTTSKHRRACKNT